jgi:L-iditol 2-dehydrogenase
MRETVAMHALVLRDLRSVAFEERPKPVPATGEALVRVLSAGICGSEIHAYHGKHAKRVPPAIMGHEVCGIVQALGPGVEGPAVGTRVVVLPQKACGACHWCGRGTPNLCDRKVMLGETSWAGGYAEFFTTPAELLYAVPDHVSDDVATLIEPLAVAVHAVRRGRIGRDDAVMVMGAGAIGLMTVVAARQAGARVILATDIVDYNLDRSRALGATHTLNVSNGDPVELAHELTGGFGLDAALMAADAPGLFDQAIDAVRKQGSVVLIAMFPDARSVNLQNPKAREQAVLGSLTFTQEDFATARDIVGAHADDLAACITHRFPLGEGERAFRLADERGEDLIRVVLKP